MDDRYFTTSKIIEWAILVVLPLTLAAVLLLGGCSFLEKMNQPAPWPTDKIPVYQEQGVLKVPSRELERYRCVEGVLLCHTYPPTSYCTCESQVTL